MRVRFRLKEVTLQFRIMVSLVYMFLSMYDNVMFMLSGSSKRRRTKAKRRQNAAEVDTDSGISDHGWIACKTTTSKHCLPRLGDPILCVDATFTVS